MLACGQIMNKTRRNIKDKYQHSRCPYEAPRALGKKLNLRQHHPADERPVRHGVAKSSNVIQKQRQWEPLQWLDERSLPVRSNEMTGKHCWRKATSLELRSAPIRWTNLEHISGLRFPIEGEVKKEAPRPMPGCEMQEASSPIGLLFPRLNVEERRGPCRVV